MAEGATVNVIVADDVRQRLNAMIEMLRAAGLSEGHVAATVRRCVRVVHKGGQYRMEFYGEAQ